MKYVKPEVVFVAAALDAVLSDRASKPEPHIVIDLQLKASDGAYEADE